MNIKMTFLLSAFALGVAAVAGPATASILNWKLENVLFDDGGQMFGTFSVDTTVGAVTAFDVTTTTGSILAGFHYDAATGFVGGDLLSGNSFIIQDNGQDRYIQFDFANPLTSGGVNSLLLPSVVGSGSFECNNCVLIRSVLAGGDAGTIAVPEPSTWAMMLVGFAGLGFAGYRQTARNTIRHGSLPV
jgi:PEP-CTERM motif